MQRGPTHFLSATIGPSVALVSAPRQMPPSHINPTIVVPVLVALGSDSLDGPAAEVRAVLRMWLEKSKPPAGRDATSAAAIWRVEDAVWGR